LTGVEGSVDRSRPVSIDGQTAGTDPRKGPSLGPGQAHVAVDHRSPRVESMEGCGQGPGPIGRADREISRETEVTVLLRDLELFHLDSPVRHLEDPVGFLEEQFSPRPPSGFQAGHGEAATFPRKIHADIGQAAGRVQCRGRHEDASPDHRV